MKPYLPAVFLAIFSLAAGTLPGGATAGGVAVGLATIWLALPLALPAWRDPLGMGRRGRLLVPMLLLVVVASWVLSPVRRAGLLAVTLLPAWLLLPAAIAGCWGSPEARRRGSLALAAVVGVVALWGVGDRLLAGSPRAAMPIGHHTALAAWLVVTWPIVWEGAASEDRWKGWRQVTVALALTALVLTGSLAGMVVAVLEMGAFLVLRGRHEVAPFVRRKAALGMTVAVAVVLALQGERLVSVVRGIDSSARARWVYLEGGLRGWSARPWLGWGPGSVPWTVSEFLRPRPGVNPPGEVVGDLHSLPVQLAYELGLVGWIVVTVTAGLFWWRRYRESDDVRYRGGLVALGGVGVMALTHAGLAITALPMAVVVAAGAALAAVRQRVPTAGRTAWPGRVLWIYRLGMLGVLAPLLVAQFHYDRAVKAGGDREARAALDRAIALDPDFPLYRARRAWLPVSPDGASRAVAESLDAARQGRGLSLLWLEAGARGLEAGKPWAAAALSRACRLDPLAAPAPFLLSTAPIAMDAAAGAAVRAVLAEPRLAASPRWSDRPVLQEVALDELRVWPAVPDGWRQEMVGAWLAVAAVDAAPEVRQLGLEIDHQSALAWSLHAFRRRPWPARLVRLEVDAASLRKIDLAPAASLSRTGRQAFERGCDEAAEVGDVTVDRP